MCWWMMKAIYSLLILSSMNRALEALTCIIVCRLEQAQVNKKPLNWFANPITVLLFHFNGFVLLERLRSLMQSRLYATLIHVAKIRVFSVSPKFLEQRNQEKVHFSMMSRETTDGAARAIMPACLAASWQRSTQLNSLKANFSKIFQ